MVDRVGDAEDRVPGDVRKSLNVALGDAARTGGTVSVGRIVEALLTAHPENSPSPIDLAEAVLREASARGLSVIIG